MDYLRNGVINFPGEAMVCIVTLWRPFLRISTLFLKLWTFEYHRTTNGGVVNGGSVKSLIRALCKAYISRSAAYISLM